VHGSILVARAPSPVSVRRRGETVVRVDSPVIDPCLSTLLRGGEFDFAVEKILSQH